MTKPVKYEPTAREQAFLDKVEDPKYDRGIINGLNPFFEDRAPGVYDVSATWVGHPNRATNAPYRALEIGGTELTMDLGGGPMPATAGGKQETDPAAGWLKTYAASSFLR